MIALFAALLIDAAIGYPAIVFRAIGHPVVWMGALIGWLDRRWNAQSMTQARRRLNGVLALVALVSATGAAAAALQIGLIVGLPWFAAGLMLAVPCAALIAQRSLAEHVSAVADGLDDEGLSGGRDAVAKIVGRSPASLDEAGVSRAAIESLAENFSDGVVAPAMWCGLLGVPGIAVYKAINTADSMIGHTTDRHRAFGWAAARLDDLVNLPAARLAALWIALAAMVMPGARGRDAVVAAFRDAARHRSPNAGWPEAAMAGALGLRLGGPREYEALRVDDPWMGSGRADANAADIRRALRLYRIACVFQVAVVAVLFGVIAPWR